MIETIKGAMGLTPSLKEIGDYTFPEVVVKRTRSELDITNAEMELIEVSLKDFFYAVKAGEQVEMTNSKVDALWHNFILDTVSYREFCEGYIGFFIDHNPYTIMRELDASETKANIEKIQKSATPAWKTKRDEIVRNSNVSDTTSNDLLFWYIIMSDNSSVSTVSDSHYETSHSSHDYSSSSSYDNDTSSSTTKSSSSYSSCGSSSSCSSSSSSSCSSSSSSCGSSSF